MANIGKVRDKPPDLKRKKDTSIFVGELGVFRQIKSGKIVIFGSVMFFILLALSVYPVISDGAGGISDRDSISSGIGAPEATGYNLINPNGTQPLGVISIENIVSLGRHDPLSGGEYGMGFPNITYTYLGFEFMGTLEPATINTWSPTTKQSHIKIRVNETVRYDYWYNDTRTMTNFKSELSDGELYAVYLNGTPIPKDELIFVEGSISYNYSAIHERYPNGTLIMSYITDYDLNIDKWQLLQSLHYGYYYLENLSNTFEVYYNYTFIPGYLGLNLTATFLVNLPDKDYVDVLFLLYRTNLETEKGYPFTSYEILPNKTIRLTMEANGTDLFINFKTNFTVGFREVYFEKWHDDYLYSDGIRARRYMISCLDGPPSLLVSYFTFNESDIPYPDLVSAESFFGRNVSTADMNYTGSYKIRGTIVFAYSNTRDTDKWEKYYLVKGETDIVTLYYRCTQRLNIIVFDSVKTPVRGARLKLYYKNSSVRFGTYMSADKTYPLPDGITDGYGQVIIEGLPVGEFLVEIYYNGEFVKNATVTTDTALNYIYTDIPHFPLWIITFTSVSAVITMLGVVVYYKNRH